MPRIGVMTDGAMCGALRVTVIAVIVAALQGASPATGAAQSQGAPWGAWFGCWTPVEASYGSLGPTTCVLPVPGERATATIALVRAGEVVEETIVRADGTRHPLGSESECVGWEAVTPSVDGRRLYRSGELRCGNLPVRGMSGVFAFTPAGEWLTVTTSRSGSAEHVEVTRMRAVARYDVPERVRARLVGTEQRGQLAREDARTRVSVTQTQEAAKALDPAAVEGWVTEISRPGGLPFRLAASDLIALDDAGVPARTIDVLVALANPAHFTVALGPDGVAMHQTSPVSYSGGDGGGPILGGMRNSWGANCGWGSWASSGWGMMMPMLPFWTLGTTTLAMADQYCLPMSPFAFDRRYGLFGFANAGMYPGFFPGYGWFPNRVTVLPQPATPRSGGAVDRTRGYVPGRTNTERGSATPRTGSVKQDGYSSGSAATRSSSGTSGRSSSTSSSGSSSSGSTRTAKPRDP